MIPRIDWAQAPAWARWRLAHAARAKRAAVALASVGRKALASGAFGLPSPRRAAPPPPPPES